MFIGLLPQIQQAAAFLLGIPSQRLLVTAQSLDIELHQLVVNMLVSDSPG
ncbi:hypothetical protein [Nostoc sp.]